MRNKETRRLRIFTWHIHGSYLYYLSQGDYDLFIPVNAARDEGYYGRGRTFPFGSNVIEVPEEEVRNLKFDCILFQTRKNYLVDQYQVLSDEQRGLPCVYLEHDPPWDDPTDSAHVMTREDGILVHVTHFNKLMWKSRCPHVKVIEHGVTDVKEGYEGRMERGIVVINNLFQRGRKLGADLFQEAARQVPLHLAGMGTAQYGGLGEVLHPNLPGFVRHYRFFFNPIRYTSLGLAVCEAMMVGMPIVTLATTEYVTVVENGVSGFIHTDPEYLIDKMKLLLESRTLAVRLGCHARKTAQKRFGIARFVKDWEQTFREAAQLKSRVYERQVSIHQ
jgi:glycosyltransferase involved in cell wall biosynthesis